MLLDINKYVILEDCDIISNDLAKRYYRVYLNGKLKKHCLCANSKEGWMEEMEQSERTSVSELIVPVIDKKNGKAKINRLYGDIVIFALDFSGNLKKI